jgi:hypothetical protein
MKKMALAILIALPLFGGSASAIPVPPFVGNDTGGIIAYSPQAYRERHAIAGDHCAQYGKLHRITSAYRRYGEYIAFSCYRPRGIEGIVIRRGG